MSEEVTVRRLFDIPYYQHSKYNLSAAFKTKSQAKWEDLSSQEYISKAKLLGDYLIVIVNSDHQAALKKGESFMNERERVEIEWNYSDTVNRNSPLW